jgi:hypothetical protein
MQQRERLAHRLEERLVQPDNDHVVARWTREALAQEAHLRVHHLQVERGGQAPVRGRRRGRQHHEVRSHHHRATAAHTDCHGFSLSYAADYRDSLIGGAL